MYLKIIPVAKPRLTQRDRWAKRPAVVKYFAFKDQIRAMYKEELPERVALTFFIPMPQSWSNKKRERMFLKPHQQRPDTDNLIKAVLDSLCDEDSHVWEIHAIKVWSEIGGISIGEVEDEIHK